MGEVRHFADEVIAQRGVRHGHLHCLTAQDEVRTTDPPMMAETQFDVSP